MGVGLVPCDPSPFGLLAVIVSLEAIMLIEALARHHN
jgi:hypothetical protein